MFEHDIIIILITFVFILILSLGIRRSRKANYLACIICQGVGTVCVINGIKEGYAFIILAFIYLIGTLIAENLNTSENEDQQDIDEAGFFDNFIILALLAYLCLTIYLLLLKHNSYFFSLGITIGSIIVLTIKIRKHSFKGLFWNIYSSMTAKQNTSDDFIYKIAEGRDDESLDFTEDWKEKVNRQDKLDETKNKNASEQESDAKENEPIAINENSKMKMMLCSQCGAKVKKEDLISKNEYMEVKCSYCGSTNYYY